MNYAPEEVILVKVLVLLSGNPGDGFLVKLHTEKLIQEIKGLIGKRSNSRAMATALAKGQIEREVECRDSNAIDAELVLTMNRVCWNPKLC